MKNKAKITENGEEKMEEGKENKEGISANFYLYPKGDFVEPSYLNQPLRDNFNQPVKILFKKSTITI